MPNWCHNTLSVKGDNDTLNTFKKQVAISSEGEREQPLYFSSLVPQPETESDADFGWYAWNVGNWGSKWEPSFSHGAYDNPDYDRHSPSREAPGLIQYSFDTAWSPPCEWVKQASEVFPTLNFTISYGEPGNGFAGREEFIAGGIVDSKDLPIEEVLGEEEMWF